MSAKDSCVRRVPRGVDPAGVEGPVRHAADQLRRSCRATHSASAAAVAAGCTPSSGASGSSRAGSRRRPRTSERRRDRLRRRRDDRRGRAVVAGQPDHPGVDEVLRRSAGSSRRRRRGTSRSPGPGRRSRRCCRPPGTSRRSSSYCVASTSWYSSTKTQATGPGTRRPAPGSSRSSATGRVVSSSRSTRFCSRSSFAVRLGIARRAASAAARWASSATANPGLQPDRARRAPAGSAGRGRGTWPR